ncbi:MAG: hypothetical protein U1E21_17740 [Reyranellaceae bacterium]|jgi:hypothetical protein
MTKRMFELKAEELRAVIGGATYYSAVNKLPAFPVSDALARPSTPLVAADRPATR